MTVETGEDDSESTPAARVLRRTVELACIPAPTGAEHIRASVVRRWWDDDGWAPSVDSVGNVSSGRRKNDRARVRCRPAGG